MKADYFERTDKAMNDNANVIILPTEEETREFWRKQHELDQWAHSLTDEQIDSLCNRGTYNDAIRGYLIAAARNAGLSEEQTRGLVRGLYRALDDNTKADAERISEDF